MVLLVAVKDGELKRNSRIFCSYSGKSHECALVGGSVLCVVLSLLVFGFVEAEHYFSCVCVLLIC